VLSQQAVIEGMLRQAEPFLPVGEPGESSGASLVSTGVE
jgi:hypothetical protein